MRKTIRLVAFMLAMLMTFSMSQIFSVFAMANDGEDTTSKVQDVQEAQNTETTGDQTTATTEDTMPLSTEDTSPAATGERGTSQEPVIVTVTGSAVDELNTPVNDLEIHLVAVEGQELPNSDWEKIDLTTESSEFHFEMPANIEYRMTITAKAKAYDDYTTTLTVEEDTDLGKLVLPFATMNLTFILTNAKATCMYTNGTNVYNVSTDDQNPVSVRYGTAVTVRFTPADGCELPNIASVNGEEVVLSNNGFNIPACEDDLEIKLTAKDVTAPEITNIAIADPDVWTQSKIVTFTATDNTYSATELQLYTSTALYTSVNQVQGSAIPLPDHKYVVTRNSTFYVYAIDPEGNMSKKSYEITKIDRTAPVISDLTADENGWTTKVTYSFHAEDNAELSRVYWVSALGIEHNLDLTEDGNYEFAVYINGNIQIIAEDTAGNRTTTSTTVENIDNDPPAITDIVVQTKWDARKNLVMFAVTDNVGIGSVAIINEAGEKETLTLNEGESTYRYYATANGTYTIKAVDTVGNESTTTFSVNHIDTASPVITSLTKNPAQEWTNTSVQIRIDTEDTQSGIDKVYIINEANLTAETGLNDWQVVTANDEGEYFYVVANNINRNEAYIVCSTDKVGRISDKQTITVNIDIDKPTISALTPNAETWATEITYSFTVTDNGELAGVTWTSPSGSETVLEQQESGAYAFSVSENGTHVITAKDKAGNETTVEQEVTLIDLEAPVISEIETQTEWAQVINTATIHASDNAEIAEVSVTDEAGEKTVVTEEDAGVYVFTATQNGTYTATVVDVAGNETSAEFTIAYIDTDAPEITSYTVEPDNEWNAVSVKITLTASDSQSGVRTVRTMKDSEMESNSAMTEWPELQLEEDGSYIYTIPNDVDSDETYYFVCEDNVGRFSEPLSFNIKIDITEPAIFDVEADKDTWSREIVYTFHATDNGMLSSVSCTTPSGQKTEYELNDTGVYEFTAIENGEYVLEAVDMAGNTTTKTIIVNKVDCVDPVIESVSPQQTWDANENTVVIIASDNAEMQRVYVTDEAEAEHDLTVSEENTYTFTAPSNGTYTVTAVDVAGNTATETFIVDHIDTEIPVITSATMDPDAEWTSSAITVTVATEDTQSGIKSIRYRFASGEEDAWTEIEATEGQTEFTFTIPNSSSLFDYCQIVTADNVGRVSDVTELYFQIDVDAPVISALTPNTDTGAHEIPYTFTVTDNGALASVTWTLNGEQQDFELTEDGAYSVTITENGTLTITATDKAGNTTTKSTTVGNIDWTPPTITAYPQQTWDAAVNSVRIYVTDALGVATVEVIDGEGTVHQVVADGESYIFTTTQNGSYTVRAVDDAGNEATLPFVVDHIDKNAPMITSVTKNPPSEWTAEMITITVNASDEESGIKALYYRFASDAGDGTWTMVAAAEGQTELSFTIPNAHNWNDICQIIVEDNVGRKSEQSEIEFKIDVENPVISELVPSTVGGAHQIGITFSVSDNGVIDAVSWKSPDGVQHDLTLNAAHQYAFTVTENGTIYVTAKDKAGNTTTVSMVIGNIDWNAPVVTVQPQQTWDATQNSAQIYVTDEFAISVVEVLDANGTAYPVTAQGMGYLFTTTLNGNYTVRAVDEAGNESLTPFTVDHIDTEKPVITGVQKNPDTEWTPNTIVITVSSSDSQSGVKSMHYRFASAEDNNWHEVRAADGQTVFTITIPNDKDWKDICQIVIEDNVGRKSTVSTMEFGVDVTAPINFVLEMDKGEDSGFFTTLTNLFAYGLLYRDYITFHAFADDPSSGVDYYEYQFVEKDQTPADNGWTRMTMKEENGNVSAKAVVKADDFAGYLHVRVYDNCGNMMEYATNQDNSDSFIVVLENTPKTDEERAEAPVITSKTADGAAYEAGVWTSQSVTVSAKAEGAISGVKRYEVQIVPTGSTYTENAWQEAPGSKVTISTDSNVDVYFRAVSYAENASRISSTTVRVQKTAPQNAVVSLNGTQGLNAWYITIPQIVITEPTPAPTHAKIKTWYNLHAVGASGEDLLYGENKPVIHGDGVYELVVWTVDEAGNVSGKSSQIISVDTTAPTELDITVDGTSVLAGNQNTAVYKHIYGRAITVRNTSNCNVSGQLSVSYQKVYDMSQYDVNGSWAAWPQNGLQIVPDENCVIYLRVIDNAGNTTIVHSDGIVLDKTAPSDISLSTVGANGYGYYAGDGTVDVKVSDPDVNGAYVGLRSISYEVIRDGVVTQSETIRVGENGVNIRQTDLQRGNNGVVSYWNGRINILAAENNSDNIIVRVTATDNVGNARTSSTTPGAVRIDTTAPTAVMFYNNNRADSSYGTAHFNADRILTIKVTERDFAAGLAELIITRNGVAETASLNWVKTAGKLENGDDNVYTASITLHEDGEYKVSLKIRDYAGNEASSIRFTDGTVAGNTFVIDQTAPKIEVSYDNNDVKNEHYFDAARTMTITVTDASFAPDRFTFQITAEKDGQAVTVPTLSGWTHDGEKHIAAIRFTEDGDYTFTCAVVDKAGNKSADASYGASKAPMAFTIDTVPVEVRVDGLEKNTAYSGELKPTVAFQDINFDNYTVKLTMTNMEIKDKDVTEKFVSEKDQKLSLDFSAMDIDGIYILTYSFMDKAGHVTEDLYKFTVNRNGSVYEYSPDLLALINGYVRSVNGVYTITEYNPSPVEKSNVIITLDGEPLDNVLWNTETANANGENWYKYVHTIEEANYVKDGKYRTTLSTQDGAENQTENTNSGSPEIIFWLDTTAPEISSIVGMEESILNASSKEVKIALYDTIGLAQIQVYVSENGENETLILDKQEFADEEISNCSVAVVLQEGLRQHVRIVVTDKAGNMTDSDKDQLNAAIAFVPEITISKNFFTRWYADPWVFFGSIGGGLAVIVGTIGLIILLKKKKKEKKAKNSII